MTIITKDTDIDACDLSVRTANYLDFLGITKVGQLTQKSASELLKGNGDYRSRLGRKSLKELRAFLQDAGLCLKGAKQKTTTKQKVTKSTELREVKEFLPHGDGVFILTKDGALFYARGKHPYPWSVESIKLPEESL